MKILLVEDDERIAQPLAENLTDQNYIVDIALDGEAGWDFVQAFAYDLILLDVMLPDLNGIDVLKRIRAEASRLPVVVCSTAYNPNVVEQALAAGATRVFDKSKLTALDLVAEFRGALSPAARKRLAA